jgi:3-dehydroquinate synthase
MPTIWVRFGDGRDYPIIIEPGILEKTGDLVQPRVRSHTLVLLSHPRIFRLYGPPVMASLRKAGFTVHSLLVPEGETSKNLALAEDLIGRMIRLRLDRKSALLALGGGVIGDLGGFLASVYMRGIDFIQIPTSLLAQVDSSVGGKVAVNHPLGKNLIGAFLQPRLVITDPTVLRSLPLRQFRSGLAEVIKTAVIADAAFFRELEIHLPEIMAQDMPTLSRAIRRSCAIKARVVETDEKERGIRAILNYGHTVGHALEAFHHYQGYLHGEALAVGMTAASRLARASGLCDDQTVLRQENLLEKAGLPIRGQGESVSKILTLMKADKKSISGEMNFILTPQIGNARICKKILSFSERSILKTVLARN